MKLTPRFSRLMGSSNRQGFRLQMKRIYFRLGSWACIALIASAVGFIMQLLFAKPLFTAILTVVVGWGIIFKLNELEKKWFD